MSATRPTVVALLLVLAALFATSAPVAAADTLPSDQPGASTGWVAIDEKQVQIEIAGLFQYDNVLRGFTVPFLGRIGVLDEELEIRAGITSIFSYLEAGGGDEASAFNNPYFGVKWHFFDEDDIRLSLLVEFAIPTGPAPFRFDSVIFRPVFIFGWQFHDDAELIVNLGFNIGERVTFFLVVGVGIALSDDLSLGVNFGSDSGDLDNSNFTSTVDVTFGIALSGDLQLDLSVIKSLDDTEQIAFYVGVTIRFR